MVIHFLKLCQSGTISPNLVTLIVIFNVCAVYNVTRFGKISSLLELIETSLAMF